MLRNPDNFNYYNMSLWHYKTLCKLLGLFNSQKLGCEGPKPGSGQTSRTSSGRTLQCMPLRPWLAGPDRMSGLVPAERVRSFLEKLIHEFGQNQWLYRFIKNETFCDSLFFQTRGRLQWVLNHRPESEGHPPWPLIILSRVFFLQF